MTSYEALRREYERERIGPEMLALIRDASASVSHPFPPRVYNAPEGWTSDAIDDLVQDVVTSQLLGAGQLEYIWNVADTLDSVQRLLAFQVRRTLVGRRTRSVVDNLLRRCVEILERAPFVREERGRSFAFRLQSRDVESREATAGELKRLALSVAGLPRRPGTGAQRASPVYSTDVLNAMLVALAAESNTWLTRHDLDSIFRELLTPWLVTTLEANVDTETAASALTPEEQAMVDDTVNRLLLRLDPAQRSIYQLKAAAVSDVDISRLVAVSRPTLAKRKRETFDIVSSELDDESERIKEAVLEALLVAILSDGHAGHVS